MRCSWVIIACFLLGVVLLSALREGQATSAEQLFPTVPVQDCDRLAQPPNMGPRYPVRGVATEKIDDNAALEACERAMRQFSEEVRFKLYLARVLEHLNRLDQARIIYRLAAYQGDPVAQTNLGSMYADGRGGPQDYKEAVFWYMRAALQGNARAQYNLGAMSAAGRGVPQDYSEALKWFRLAADQGHADAQGSLGIMYESGMGVPQSDAEAVKWFRLAADKGDALSQASLGFMYESGKGVPQSNTKAVKWYRLAAKQGNKVAQEALQRLDNASP
jgi:TPR repeat protein